MPSMACCDICIRLVPPQDPMEIFEGLKQHVESVFRGLHSTNQVYVQLVGHGQSWRTNKLTKNAKSLYGAAHEAVQQVRRREEAEEPSGEKVEEVLDTG